MKFLHFRISTVDARFLGVPAISYIDIMSVNGVDSKRIVKYLNPNQFNKSII